MPDRPPDALVSVPTRGALAARFPATLFPCGRDRLADEAEAQFADNDLVAALREMPDASYRSLDEVCIALERVAAGGEGA
jgi:hypothetical protein